MAEAETKLTDPVGPRVTLPVFVPSTKDATAHHEAGHAAVAMATGILRLDGALEYLPGDHAYVPMAGRGDLMPAWEKRGGTEQMYNEILAIVAAARTEAERLYLEEADRHVSALRPLWTFGCLQADPKTRHSLRAVDRYRMMGSGTAALGLAAAKADVRS